MNNVNNQVGFTLMELLIAVAIIGILSSIAYPSYQEIVSKSRRQDAMDVLTGLASALERHKTANGSYMGAASGGDTGAPSIYSAQSPISGSTKYYDLTIVAATNDVFTIQATPIGSTSQKEDGFIELLSTNRRGWDEDDSGSLSSSEFVWN